ncbi:hypothetical protein CCP4SC76_2440001 [Gammaproteobacteria bacterium]
MLYWPVPWDYWTCCHGDDEVQVYGELCQIVKEWINIALEDEKSLPPPTIGWNIPNKIMSEYCHNRV